MHTVYIAALLLHLAGVVLTASVGGDGPRIGGDEPPFEWLLNQEYWTEKDDPLSIVPQATYTGCGGVIAISSSLDMIEYKPTAGIAANTRCVWALDSNYSRIEVFTDTMSFPTDAGLVIYYFNTNATTSFTRYKVPNLNQANYVLTSHLRIAYIVMSSSSASGGQGFRIGIKGSTSLTRMTGFNSRANSTTGSLRSHSTQYQNDERSGFVYQPPVNRSSTVRITTFDTELTHDNLYMYVLTAYTSTGTTLAPSGTYNGYHPFGPANSSTTSREPRVFIFRTDRSVTNTGFTIEWL